jgi:uncharacterized protein (AIM24 family)
VPRRWLGALQTMRRGADARLLCGRPTRAGAKILRRDITTRRQEEIEMHIPEPIPTAIHDESFAGVTYHVRGELVPELQIEVSSQPVMFEHHVLLWKETQLNIELKKLPGGVKRKIAGLEFFVTRTSGSGSIAFSRDSPGQCIPLHLSQGEGLDVREHQFLAATDNLDYSYERIKGVQNMVLGGSGFFMDKFRASDGDALVWLHGHGNVFEVSLQDGEQLDVEAGAWLYKDPTVQLDATTMGLKSGIFGGGGKLTWNRFTGPGRLAVQTMFIAPAEGEESSTAAAAGAGGIAGALISGLSGSR